MFIPVQITGYLDTEVLDNIYMLQLVAIQHIRILCWVMLLRYAYYFTFVWVELPSSMFSPRQPIYLGLSEMSCCLVHFSLLNRSWLSSANKRTVDVKLSAMSFM